MNRNLQGHYVTVSTAGEKVQAFVPAPLPPAPPIEWSSELRERFDQALLVLGRLDSVSWKSWESSGKLPGRSETASILTLNISVS